MAQTAYDQLPLGAVRPLGWLAEQLALQASGLTGALEEIWPDVGPDSAWLGGTGEDWERGPYYLDGLISLAHLTGDRALLAKAERWVEAILASSGPDGQFGPRSNDDWWPRMVALKALVQHHSATDDERVLALMERYFGFQASELPRRPLRDWGRARGAENVLSVMWLHARTGDGLLLDVARLLLAQTADWDDWFERMPARDVVRAWDHMTHVVNVAMALKIPAVRYLLDGDPAHRDRAGAAIAALDRYHGQVHGFFSGDEWLAGRAANRGVELCAVVEAMFSFEELFRILGDPSWADRLETLAYNLLPAALTADMTAHQYHQQANQVLVTIEQRDWTHADDDCTIFGLEPNFGCCTANLHQGWPKFVRSLWMERPDGLTAVALGPSVVTWHVDGVDVRIEERTDYPFDEDITFHVGAERPVRFVLEIRVPAWCEDPRVLVNGIEEQAPLDEGFLRLSREWRDGDCVELRLPMRVRLVSRANDAVGVRLGPLVLAYSPGEVWSRLPDSAAFGDWEVRPRRAWNVALAVDGRSAHAARIERLGPQSPPFGLRTGPPPVGVDGVPVKVWLPAVRAHGWSLEGGKAPDPPTPDEVRAASHLPEEHEPTELPGFPLVPYGSARLRVAEFPTLRPKSTSGA